MPRAIKFQSNPVVFLAGGFAACSDQILYVIKAAILQRLGISLLGMRAVYDLAEIRGHQCFGPTAVDGCDSLAKIRTGEESRTGVELCAHLSNRVSVAAGDKHVGPDKHDHSALIASK